MAALPRESGSAVVLTADRGSYSDYSRSSPFGYFACLPSHVVPRFLMDRVFTPPAPTENGGPTALWAPYALRKVEASLHRAGIVDVAVVPPERLETAVGKRTRVVGVTAHDPYGLSPVSTKLTMLFGGGPAWNAVFFDELGARVQRLRSRCSFVTVAGGPGIWQTTYRVPDWVDTIFHGEGEVDFPILAARAIEGVAPPPVVHGRSATLEQIPTILKPARLGEVQVTRGCPRGCEFCSITPEKYRTIPLGQIRTEVELNIRHGERDVELLTDDILLYGARKLRTNHEKVVELFREVKRLGAEHLFFPHVSAPAVREAPDTIREIGEIAEYDRYPGISPVVGLETGSERIFAKYMPAKAFPWKPADWWNVVLDATRILNEANIWPCYTMTIGFPDETDVDVDRSIGIVEAIVGQDLKAWVFPLPVVPISSSRLKGNPFPELERLPTRYWDLLYVAWQRDLKLARELTATVTNRIKSRIADRFFRMVADRFGESLLRIFAELSATRGRLSHEFRSIDLNRPFGWLRMAYWTMQAAVSRADPAPSAVPARGSFDAASGRGL
jgi:radical SAM superfamily enzyme YgiQ (UPF0313 family)